MKKIITGIQATNNLTLGNYLGVIKPLIELSKKNKLILFIADLHAITIPFDPEQLRKNRQNIALIYKSVGFDFEKDLIFFQSDVPEHLELNYILQCHSNVGELQRMTQYKDKSSKMVKENKTLNIPTGLLIYPILMASDILIYDPDIVYVGKDQKQHVELTRDLAQRFNKKYKNNIFNIVTPMFNDVGSKILDLQDPKIKMSKSNSNQKGTIFLLEDIDSIRKKIMSAKTDSFDIVKYDEINQPGISNLINIYCALTNKSKNEVEEKFKGKKYGDFKKEVADVLCNELSTIQQNYKKHLNDDISIKIELDKNAKKCREITSKKIQEIYKIIGMK